MADERLKPGDPGNATPSDVQDLAHRACELCGAQKVGVMLNMLMLIEHMKGPKQ